MTIANQANVIKAMRSLLQEQKPQPPRSGLTPTQRFIVSDLKSMIQQKDSNGKPQQFKHWEIRRLKDTRTILLVSMIGTVQRYILIGSRGHLQQLDKQTVESQMQLDEAITELVEAEVQGNA